MSSQHFLHTQENEIEKVGVKGEKSVFSILISSECFGEILNKSNAFIFITVF